MQIEVLADAAAVATRGAAVVAAAARDAVVASGRFVVAVSGGTTPWAMLRALAGEKVPWEQVYVIQVDERVAPAGDKDRNLTHLRDGLLSRVPSLRPEQVLAMPVEMPDLSAAARQYADALREIAGSPPVPDLVHLGLGPDGHTASLVPGDPVLSVTDADVAPTGVYQGRRRLTLTYPIINRSPHRMAGDRGGKGRPPVEDVGRRPDDPGRASGAGTGASPRRPVGGRQIAARASAFGGSSTSGVSHCTSLME